MADSRALADLRETLGGFLRKSFEAVRVDPDGDFEVQRDGVTTWVQLQWSIVVAERDARWRIFGSSCSAVFESPWEVAWSPRRSGGNASLRRSSSSSLSRPAIGFTASR